MAFRLKMKRMFCHAYLCELISYPLISMKPNKYLMAYRLAALLAVAMISLLPDTLAQQLSLEKIKQDVFSLASDTMKGRKPGTPEGQLASMYIRRKMQETGLKMLESNGFQKFDVVYDVKLGKLNSLTFEGFEGKAGLNYTPYSFSENARLDAPGVFAGYGFSIRQDSLIWDDYQGVDVKNRWVMIFRGDPESDKSDSPYSAFADERGKVLTAKDKGAIGVIFVTGEKLDSRDTVVPLQYDKSGAKAGIPVLHVTRAVADHMLARTGKKVAELEKQLIETRKPMSFQIPLQLKATVQIAMQQAMTVNVIGMLEGSDSVLKHEYVVIGAHYDHLGMGGPGSGSRMPDTLAIHNGADDNASGVAGVIALAGYFAAAPVKPARSMIFVAFTAEESGLLGSKYFVKHCPVDLKKITAMINLDMIGRLQADSGSLMISGTGTSAEAMDIIQRHANHLPFRLKFSPEGYGASDHSSFYVEDIPVFFFTTGAHDDYHTPFDDAEKLNFQGQQSILAFIADIVKDIASRDKALSFREAGPKGSQQGYRRFKVTLGILPDFAGNNNHGLRVDGVKKEGPAEKGGMMKGDVITAMNGKSVGNIYEYMDRLKTLEHGQTVIVDILRQGEKMVLLIQL